MHHWCITKRFLLIFVVKIIIRLRNFMNIWYERTKKDIYLLCQIVILKKSELYRNWYSLGILTQDSPGSFLFWKTKLLHFNINASSWICQWNVLSKKNLHISMTIIIIFNRRRSLYKEIQQSHLRHFKNHDARSLICFPWTFNKTGSSSSIYERRI